MTWLICQARVFQSVGKQCRIHTRSALRYAAADADPEELEAAVLGAQWVAERGDAALADAARDLLSKITAAVPQSLRTFITDPTLGTPENNLAVRDGLDLAKARSWIRAGRKLRIQYRDEAGQETERVVWPVILGYTDAVRLLVAWCELRNGFRHFRTDRIMKSWTPFSWA